MLLWACIAWPLRVVQSQTVLPCSTIASSYGIDSTLVDDTARLNQWLASLPDTSYSNLSVQCFMLDTKVQHMLSSLRNAYPIHDNLLWLDSTIAIRDYKSYASKLSNFSEVLLRKSAYYDKMVKQRMLQEIRKAEAEARTKAVAEQKVRNDSLTVLKEEIDGLHHQMDKLTDDTRQRDKTQISRMKDLYYSYLSIYNKYDLSIQEASTQQLGQLRELKSLQRNIIDSLLGENSYERRIQAFTNTIRQRCATNHKAIGKSYIRTFRDVDVPIHFNSIRQYYDYVQQLRDILAVQQSYIHVIELCDSIADGGRKVLLAAKRHKQVITSYKAALDMVDMEPAFTTRKEGERFIGKLQEFLSVQEKYLQVMQHMDSIDMRSRDVLTECQKSREYSDLSSAYKELLQNYDFSPSFTTQEGAAFFDKTLYDFEVLQDTYLRILGLRQLITAQEDKILEGSYLPMEVKRGYKLIKSVTQMKPDFSTVARGELFIQSMKDYIRIQEKVLLAAAKQQDIDGNIKRLKAWKKNNPGIVHAYTILRNKMKQEFIITSEADLDEYITYQDRQLKLQDKFINVIQSEERMDYNRRLKGVRNAEEVRLIMNL